MRPPRATQTVFEWDRPDGLWLLPGTDANGLSQTALRYIQQAEALLSDPPKAALSAPGQPPCKQCGGSGKVHSHNDICWVCDGTGHALGQPEGER
jgi:hypothetical protein